MAQIDVKKTDAEPFAPHAGLATLPRAVDREGLFFPGAVRSLVGQVAEALAPLWVSGLAILLVLGVAQAWPLEGKALDHAQYLALGTAFPALVVLLALLARFAWFVPIYRIVELVLALGCGVASVFLILGLLSYHILVTLLAPGLLLIAFTRYWMPADGRGETAAPPVPDPERLINLFGQRCTALVNLFVAAVAWIISVRLLGDSYQTWVDTPYTPLGFGLAALLVLINLCHEDAPGRAARFRVWPLRLLVDGAAVLIIAILSFRSDQLFGQEEPLMSFTHWSYFVGPAELVRQGGWLLWDVPSIYGFFNILLVALFPTQSVWQSMYVVNSLLIFLSAGLLFFLLRSLRSGVTNYVFSLAVTLAAVFLIPPGHYPPVGPQIFPSIGAFRFFWCYVLLAVLVWELRRTLENRSTQRLLWAGCISWVVGTFWSAESAIYCAGIWLPAYALIILRNTLAWHRRQGILRKSIRFAALWLMLPILLFGLVFGMITVYYLLFLKQAPDWRAFLEYVISFGSRYTEMVRFAVPLEPGPSGSLFVLFCAVSTAAFYLIRNGPAQALSLISGAWAALWTTSSYFLFRGDGYSFTYMLPIFCTVIVLVLYIFKQYGITGRWAALIKMSFVSFLVVILTAAFGDREGLPTMVRGMHTIYNLSIDDQLPVLDESLSSLLDKAQVKPEDPIFDIDEMLGLFPVRLIPDKGGYRRISYAQAWLPLKPYGGELPPRISEERAKLYVARFIARKPMSGYLAVRAGLTELPWETALPTWLFDQLALTHEQTLVMENDEYQLFWFQLKGHSTK